MAETVDENGFWLPSDFLADDDFLIARESANFNNNGKTGLTAPDACPFPPNTGGFRSLGESVVSYTELESNGDPDEYIAELTRHLAHSAFFETARKVKLQKSRSALATSQQSTWSWTGSSRCYGFESQNDDAWELFCAAATRMRMNQQAGVGLVGAPRSASFVPLQARTPPVLYNAPQSNQFQNVKMHVKEAWRNGTALGLPQSAWPPLRRLQHHQIHPRAALAGGCDGGGGVGGSGIPSVFVGGGSPPAAGVRRQSTGTGVFLPRRIGTNSPPQPSKKQGCSTVLLPARVVQALNLNIDEMNDRTQPCSASPNHDILVARMNAAVLAQQRRSLVRAERPITHHELPLLPQEWTY